MEWVLVGVVIWVALALPLAVLIGRSIRLADQRRAEQVRFEDNVAVTERGRAPVPEPRSPPAPRPAQGDEPRSSGRTGVA